MGPTDLELVARVLSRDDRHAFAELVRRHQSMVRALLRRLTGGDAARSDDLAQDTFLKAYRGLAGYRSGALFGSWLSQIAYNSFVSDVRRQKETPTAELHEEAAPMPATLLRHDLARALLALPLEERTAVALTFGNDLTHEEAAEILGCPLGTLKTRVLRGKERLRLLLADWQRAEAT